MGDMDTYRDAFLSESADFIQQIIDGLLELEKSPADMAPVEVIFRGAHSLKGMAAAMGYVRTAELTHKMEGLMDRVRKGELEPGPFVVNLMLASVDFVRDLIDDESSGGSQIDPAELIASLEAAAAGEPDPQSEDSSPTAALLDDVPLSGDETLMHVTVTLEQSCVLKAVRAYMVIKRLNHLGRVVDTIPGARQIEDEQFDRSFEIVVATTATREVVKDAAKHVSEVESAAVVVEQRQEPTEDAPVETLLPLAPQAARSRQMPKLSETQTVRVAIGHLDNLVDLAGELVILRSRLEKLAETRFDAELSETIDELQRISTDLQYEVMLTRMVPVGNIFNRFPRMARDLAVELGKEIEFDMDGLDIELDRTVLDEIGDPLVHLLRNSIDHGIEEPSKRAAAGKPRTGRIRLTATRERDHIAIIVGDDGKGIDPERVWRKAVERGMVTGEQRNEYSADDILMLTCIPGFSTAEKTTKVSGRGVGMDVVKGKIEHLGGTLQIQSCPGEGTEFALRLPLTLAIVHALLVRSCDQTFALPLSAVEEVMAAEDVAVDTIDGAPVVILRDGEVVPLFRLDHLLHGQDPTRLPEARTSVVLVSSNTGTKALHVDGLAGRTEIVVKPLSKLFRETRGFSGATILGDGRVLLILDPRSIFAAQEG